MRTLNFVLLVAIISIATVWLYKAMGGLLVLAVFTCVVYTFFKKWKTTRFKG